MGANDKLAATFGPGAYADDRALYDDQGQPRPSRHDWRIAINHGWSDVDGLPTFHAYGTGTTVPFCTRALNLLTTAQAPNEGSHFCPDCLAATASGRARSDGAG